MSKATYWQKGEVIDYKNGTSATIDANTIITLQHRIGIAGVDIAVGETGTVHTVGVFQIDKTAGLEIAIGDAVFYNSTTGCITKTVTDIPAGYAVAAAAAADTSALVNIGFPDAANASATS